MLESNQSNAPASKRERSPSFPYIDLKASIDHLDKLYKAARMHEVRMIDVAAAWNMRATSGSFMRYVAAVGQFGLVDTDGSGDSRRLKVSSRGRQILEDDRPGVRERLCSEAALMPKLIRGLFYGEDGMPHWGRNRPDDGIAESSLKFDMSFTNDAAIRFLAVYDATISFIADNGAAKERIDSRVEQAEKSGEIGQKGEGPKLQNGAVERSTEVVPISGGLELNEIDFQKAGKGKIKISAILDLEGLDMLEKQIAAFRMLVG